MPIAKIRKVRGVDIKSVSGDHGLASLGKPLTMEDHKPFKPPSNFMTGTSVLDLLV